MDEGRDGGASSRGDGDGDSGGTTSGLGSALLSALSAGDTLHGSRCGDCRGPLLVSLPSLSPPLRSVGREERGREGGARPEVLRPSRAFPARRPLSLSRKAGIPPTAPPRLPRPDPASFPVASHALSFHPLFPGTAEAARRRDRLDGLRLVRARVGGPGRRAVVPAGLR
ncbi:hypothetical protein THAOC_17923, partial [Thalassiosira oceanica]